MTKKRFYSIFSTLLLLATMLFVACAEDVTVSNENKDTGKDLEGLTCFASEIPESTRTTIDKNGKFKWKEGDVIYVKDDDGKWQKSVGMRITDSDNMYAIFYMPGKYENDGYSVIYSKDGATPDEIAPVTITTEQIQSTPNNSDHLLAVGDCAAATGEGKAYKKNGKFTFTITHQFAYIMFEPRIDETAGSGKNYKLSKIWLTETNGKDIWGTIALNEDGIPVSTTSDGKSVITIICGDDVKKVEAGEKEYNDAEYYGFPFTNTNYDPYENKNGYDGDHFSDGTTPVARVYAVVKPGENYNFKVEYEVSTDIAYEQRAIHTLKKVFKKIDSEETVTVTTASDISEKESDIKWTLMADLSYWTTVPRHFTDTIKKDVGSLSLAKNTYYRFRHKLKVSEPAPVVTFDYPFEAYYMWGAKKWFWDGVTIYPVSYDGSQAENAPTAGTDRWYDTQYPTGNAVSGNTSGGTIITNYPSQVSWGNRARHRQAWGNNLGWDETLTANQMSFYVVYGDPYYDNTTPWTLEYYRGYNNHFGNETNIVCYGGVWLKKKDKIIESLPSGITWPAQNDGNQSKVFSAPFPAKAAIQEVYYGSVSYLDQLAGKQFNLRFCAPVKNYRMPYTNLAHFKETGKWKTLEEDGKNKDDYFFVPCLGRIEYQHPGAVGIPTLTLVGTQGYYWTSTPLMYNSGGSPNKFYYGNDTENGADNAYYLQILYDYIALSWEQPYVYVKTGMRKASTDMFK